MIKRDLRPWLFGAALLLVSIAVLYLPILFAWSGRNEVNLKDGKEVVILVQFGWTMRKLKIICEPLMRFHASLQGYDTIASDWKLGYAGARYEMIFASRIGTP